MITKELPIVSIICTCFNQEAFVLEALQSVVDQSYQGIEIIVIDDYSTDSSYERIQSFAKKYKIIKVVKNEMNLALCKNFNHGLKLSSGKYVIDFSCDDVLLPDRVKEQVDFFESLPSDIGVIFSNAEYIDEQGINHHYFYPLDHERLAIEKLPSGDIYNQLMSTYEICRKIKVLNKTAEEDSALIRRLEYEIKHAVLANKRKEADLLLQLLCEMQPLSLTQKFLSELNKTSLKTGWLRDFVIKFRAKV